MSNEPKPLRFLTKQEAQAWADDHEVDLMPHHTGLDFILIFARPEGIFAACSDTEGVLLADW